MSLGSGIAVSYGVGHRCGWDPVLLWLWCSLAATALIWPLAWELPSAACVALKRPKKKKKKVDLLREMIKCGPSQKAGGLEIGGGEFSRAG